LIWNIILTRQEQRTFLPVFPGERCKVTRIWGQAESEVEGKTMQRSLCVGFSKAEIGALDRNATFA